MKRLTTLAVMLVALVSLAFGTGATIPTAGTTLANYNTAYNAVNAFAWSKPAGMTGLYTPIMTGTIKIPADADTVCHQHVNFNVGKYAWAPIVWLPQADSLKTFAVYMYDQPTLYGLGNLSALSPITIAAKSVYYDITNTSGLTLGIAAADTPKTLHWMVRITDGPYAKGK